MCFVIQERIKVFPLFNYSLCSHRHPLNFHRWQFGGIVRPCSEVRVPGCLCQDHVWRTETCMLRKIDNTSRPDKCSPCLGTCTPVAANEAMMSEAGSENHGTCVSFYSQFIHPPLQKLKINNEINKKPTADITAPQKMSDLLTENMSACESDVLLIWKERGFSPIELGFTRVMGWDLIFLLVYSFFCWKSIKKRLHYIHEMYFITPKMHQIYIKRYFDDILATCVFVYLIFTCIHSADAFILSNLRMQ